jgi:predicted small secreted protein
MRRRLVSGFLAVMLLAGAGALLGACNTMHGLGQDIQDASDAVKNAF